MAKLAPGLKPRASGTGGTRPYLLLSTAAEYAHVAGLAVSGDPMALMTPIYLLTGFSVELSLKAFILQKTGDELRIAKMGHRLRDLWTAAVEQGLELSDRTISHADFAWMIDAMADHHQNLTFRYMPDVEPFVMTISPADMVKAAQALSGALRRHIVYPDAPQITA